MSARLRRLFRALRGREQRSRPVRRRVSWAGALTVLSPLMQESAAYYRERRELRAMWIAGLVAIGLVIAAIGFGIGGSAW